LILTLELENSGKIHLELRIRLARELSWRLAHYMAGNEVSCTIWSLFLGSSSGFAYTTQDQMGRVEWCRNLNLEHISTLVKIKEGMVAREEVFDKTTENFTSYYQPFVSLEPGAAPVLQKLWNRSIS
jgi:hypothetical protein